MQQKLNATKAQLSIIDVENTWRTLQQKCQKGTVYRRRWQSSRNFCKTCRDNRSESSNFKPQTLYKIILTITAINCFTGKSKLFGRKSHCWQSPQSFCKSCKDNRSESPNFKPQNLYKIILTITVIVLQGKANCFAENAISDNRRKTFTKPVRTIAVKVLISSPKLHNIILTITVTVLQGQSKLFRRKSHYRQSPKNVCRTCEDNCSRSPSFAKQSLHRFSPCVD